MESHRVNCTISGRSPPLHCTLTLITMYGHQNKNRLVSIQYTYGLKVPDYGTLILYREVELKNGVWCCVFEGSLPVIDDVKDLKFTAFQLMIYTFMKVGV